MSVRGAGVALDEAIFRRPLEHLEKAWSIARGRQAMSTFLHWYLTSIPGRVMALFRWRPAALMTLGLSLPLPLAGQAVAPRYFPLQVDCARYRQQADAAIVMEAGRERSRESTGRNGVMVLRAIRNPTDSIIQLESWFESLQLWREGSGERLEPDTDGLIGGRFHATLTPSGGMLATDTPFLPDDIAQVTDLSTALVSLLPPLPPDPLTPGRGWRDDFGTVISRMPDGTIAGRRVERYRLIRRSSRPETHQLPDSSEVRATRTESETGIFSWSAEVGLVLWERDLTDELQVEKGGVVKHPFRTRIEQRVTVTRLGGGACS